MIKNYKYKVQKHKAYYTGVGAMVTSIITGPLYTIGLAMQLSVLPHLTIYGDVTPEQVKAAQNRGLLKIGSDRVAGLIGAATGKASSGKTLLAVD